MEIKQYPSWEFENLIREKEKKVCNFVSPSMFSKCSESHQGVIEERPCILKTYVNIEDLGKLASWYNTRGKTLLTSISNALSKE